MFEKYKQYQLLEGKIKSGKTNFDILEEEHFEHLFFILTNAFEDESKLSIKRQQKIRDFIEMIAADIDDAAWEAIEEAMIQEFLFYADQYKFDTSDLNIELKD